MKTILITQGDPAGVGAEVALKAITSKEATSYGPFVIIGDRPVIDAALAMLNLKVSINEIERIDESVYNSDVINLLNMKSLITFEKSKSTPKGGAASAEYIQKAVEILLNKQAHAVVTAPISKESLKLAGITFPGHTEMLAKLTGTDDFAMMLCGGPLKVILVTIHIPLKEVPNRVTREKVLKTIMLSARASRMLGIREPRIGVAGLNPHAGEAAIFGDEEIKEIQPAIEDAGKEGIKVEGPYPPDTIFHKAYKGELDIIVAMYHDQGLIPLKMVAFESGVNVTVGLPIIRTSPDHGTAYDIAWKGTASLTSMLEAIKMAGKLIINN